MYGLVKLANVRRSLLDGFNTNKAVQEYQSAQSKAPVMNQDEVRFITEKLQNQYGLNKNTEINILDPGSHSTYFQSFDDSARIISTAPNKMTFLHEAGHALDPNFLKSNEERMKLTGNASLAQVGGGLALPTAVDQGVKAKSDEQSNGLGAGAYAGVGGAAALGGAGSLAVGRKMESMEDTANSFVKRYLTDELGDAAKAQQVFDNSELVPGRHTYRVNRNLFGIGGAIGGAMFGAGGLGVAKLIDNKMNKQASTDPEGWLSDFVACLKGSRDNFTKTAAPNRDWWRGDEKYQQYYKEYDDSLRQVRDAKSERWDAKVENVGLAGIAAAGSAYPLAQVYLGKMPKGIATAGKAILPAASGLIAGTSAAKSFDERHPVYNRALEEARNTEEEKTQRFFDYQAEGDEANGYWDVVD